MKGYASLRRAYEASVRAEQKRVKQSAFDVYEKRRVDFQVKMAKQLDSDYTSIAMISEAVRVFGTSYRDIASKMLIGEFIVEMLIHKITKLIDS